MDTIWFHSSHWNYIILIHGQQYTVHVPCNVAAVVSWHTVVQAALVHYLQELPPDQKRRFAGVKIIGVIDVVHGGAFSAEDTIPLKPVQLLPAKSAAYAAILLGPIHLLQDKLLQQLVINYLCTARDLNVLMMINRSFKRLCASDAVWQHVPFPYTLWPGYGNQGRDVELFERVRIQHGVSVFGMHRCTHIS